MSTEEFIQKETDKICWKNVKREVEYMEGRGIGLQREEGSSQGWTSESLVSRRLLGHLANEARRGLWLKGPHGAPPCPSHPVRAKLSAPGTITPFLDRSSIQIHLGS